MLAWNSSFFYKSSNKSRRIISCYLLYPFPQHCPCCQLALLSRRLWSLILSIICRPQSMTCCSHSVDISHCPFLDLQITQQFSCCVTWQLLFHLVFIRVCVTLMPLITGAQMKYGDLGIFFCVKQNMDYITVKIITSHDFNYVKPCFDLLQFSLNFIA